MVYKVTSRSAHAFVPAQHFRGLPPSRKPFPPGPLGVWLWSPVWFSICAEFFGTDVSFERPSGL